jgi:hypothetical protein
MTAEHVNMHNDVSIYNDVFLYHFCLHLVASMHACKQKLKRPTAKPTSFSQTMAT